MLTPEQIESKLDRILLRVQKPGRYVGGELNSIIKDWDSIRTKVAFVFPDIYDIGVSNVGLKILYDQVNQREDALAERAYAPWLDMEALMREHGIPLYTLESKRPLACFDLIGFSLPYETLYTNALNVLDLSGIPVRSEDRDKTHPFIIAGGHSTMNPEPLYAFMDAFVIGEGEEVIHDIINLIQKHKPSLRGAVERRRSNPQLQEEVASTPTMSRNDILKELAKIQGVYVPRFYEAYYLDDGTVSHVEPIIPDVPKIVTKRIVPVLPPPPTQFIVPNIDIVHNRVSVEIMRGCTRGCRFCHAGMITRPIRERSVEEVLLAAEAAHTGGHQLLAQRVVLLAQLGDQPLKRPKFRTLPDGRPGGGPAAPRPSAARMDGSNPPPLVGPAVQSRETVSGGRGACLPVADGAADAARPWSYAARAAGLPISAQAALSVAIRATASASLVRSGWYLRANRR